MKEICDWLRKIYSKAWWKRIAIIIAIIIASPLIILVLFGVFLFAWVANDPRIRLLILLAFVLGALSIYAIWYSPWLVLVPYSIDKPHALYFLSTIAQSLAAVLALVFTISLIAIQIWARYSLRLIGRFFSIWTISYIFLFVVSILTSIVFINKANTMGLKISLSLASICLLLLIPYFSSLRERLDITEWLWKKRQTALNSMNKDHAPYQPTETIANTTKSLLANKDFEGFEQGMRILREIYETAYASRKILIAGYTLNNIESIAIMSVRDPLSPARAISNLIWCMRPNPGWGRSKNIINKSVKDRPGYIEAEVYVDCQDRILSTLSEIGIQSILEGRTDIERLILEALLDGLESENNSDDKYNLVLDTLSKLLNQAIKTNQSIIFGEIMSSIYLFGIKARSKGKDDYAIRAAKIINTQLESGTCTLDEIHRVSSIAFIDRESILSRLDKPESRDIDDRQREQFEELLTSR